MATPLTGRVSFWRSSNMAAGLGRFGLFWGDFSGGLSMGSAVMSVFWAGGVNLPWILLGSMGVCCMILV